MCSLSYGSLQPPLSPKNGHTLEVLILCRVSCPGEGKQDERSLVDQEALHREWLEKNIDLPFNVKVIAGSGSGEHLERQEYLELIEEVASGKYDLVLSEDLSRIARRVQSYLFCEHCEDHETRLIALNDNIDIGVPGWQDTAIFSSWHHERSNRDTSNRIKRTHRNRFMNGGTLPLPIYGYEKKAGAKSDEDLVKIPEAEPIYKEIFQRLDDEATFAEIADWLNKHSIPTGQYCKKKTWDGSMLGQKIRNPILKGIRYRNKRISKRNNKTGKYKSQKAKPDDLLVRKVPHLAYFTEEYYDYIINKVNNRNAKYQRKGRNGRDSRTGVPKKRTRFPGQSTYCGVCGRMFVFGGHGQKDALMCEGARQHKCWNGLTYSGPLACELFAEAVYQEISKIPAFEPEFVEVLQEAIAELGSSHVQQRKKLEADMRKVDRELHHISEAIKSAGGSEFLLSELQKLEQSKNELKGKLYELKNAKLEQFSLPSVEELEAFAKAEFSNLTHNSVEFARLMRQLMPKIYLFPFRICCKGRPFLRASIELSVSSMLPPSAQLLPNLTEKLSSQIVVDLVQPNQCVKFLEPIKKLLNQNLKEREMAKLVGVTQPVVQRVKQMIKEMTSLGITSPCVSMCAPSEDYPKMRRHLHGRYKFEPLNGFPLNWPTQF